MEFSLCTKQAGYNATSHPTTEIPTSITINQALHRASNTQAFILTQGIYDIFNPVY
jgi:hypothetical protein